MISFCQDLSISYEYHVYENKTVKKIVRKRTGSNFSQKIITKGPKIQVISKNNPTQSCNITKAGIKLTKTQSINQLQNSKETNYQRSKSNYLNTEINKLDCRLNNVDKQQFSIIFQPNKNIKFRPLRLVETQMGYYEKEKRNCLIKQDQNRKNNEKMKFFNQQQRNNNKYINDNNNKDKGLQKSLMSQVDKRLINFQYISAKINQQRITHNIDSTHKNYLNQNNNPRYNKNSKVNIKFNENNTNNNTLNNTQFFNNYNKQQKCNNQTNYIIDHSDKNQYYNQYQHQLFTIQKQPHYSNNTKSKMNLSDSTSTKHQLINFSDDTFSPQTRLSKSIFDDAVSIQSHQIKINQNEGQNQHHQPTDNSFISILQQRNFSFSLQQQPDKIFKKSIQKYIILNEGYMNKMNKWVIYNKVEDIDTKKIYSMKQFKEEYTGLYVNQYEVYLGLKNKQNEMNQKYQYHHNHQQQYKQHHQQYHHNNQYHHYQHNNNYKCNSYVLQFFNVLTSSTHKNKNKKYDLIKQTYHCLFSEYLQNLKKIYTKHPPKSLSMIFTRIQTQICQIFRYLSQKSFKLIEQLQFEDFVICKDESNNVQKIKFHNLFKLEQIRSYKKVVNFQINYQENIDKSSQNKVDKLSMFCKKIQMLLLKN